MNVHKYSIGCFIKRNVLNVFKVSWRIPDAKGDGTVRYVSGKLIGNMFFQKSTSCSQVMSHLKIYIN